jgi:hypothetical protein
MTRVRNFLLCLVLLALAGILHHEWTQMSGTSGIEPEVRAATLGSAFVGDRCNGSATWHFVNPQNGGDCEPLTVTFNCGGTTVQTTQTSFSCLNNTTNYTNIATVGDCTLVSATNSAPGKIVLSNLVCSASTPTPTPTPSPSPSPSPTAPPA